MDALVLAGVAAALAMIFALTPLDIATARLFYSARAAALSGSAAPAAQGANTNGQARVRINQFLDGHGGHLKSFFRAPCLFLPSAPGRPAV